MGIKLSLNNVNDFLTIYSKAKKPLDIDLEKNKDVALRKTIETFTYTEKIFSSRFNEDHFNYFINKMEKTNSKNAIKILRSELPVFAILLVDDTSEFEHRSFFDDFFRVRKNSFPGFLTVLYEKEFSERIDNVHPWTSDLLNSLSSWPSIFIATPNQKTLINLSTDPNQRKKQLETISMCLAKMGDHTLSDLTNLSGFFTPSVPLDVIFHISDLHLGTDDSSERLELLINKLSKDKDDIEKNNGPCNFSVICTGDIMNNANYSELKLAKAAKRKMKRDITEKVFFIAGNHDSKKKFGNWGIRQENAFRDLFDHGPFWIFENSALLSLNSNINPLLARGNIPDLDLKDYEEELNSLLASNPIENPLIFAALHHHPVKVEINEPFKKDWYEKILGPLITVAVDLNDSETIAKFFHDINAKYVLFGHQHQPHYVEKENVRYIGSGSSLGHREYSGETTVFSYNKIMINNLSKISTIEYILFRKDLSNIPNKKLTLKRTSHYIKNSL